MFKKKTLIVFAVLIIIFGIFVGVVSLLFNYIQDNSIDNVSMPYIANQTEISDEYGEIVDIGRMVFMKVKETGDSIKVPYGVDTTENKLTIYVTLEKHGEKLVAKSYEIIEVSKIDD